MTPRLKITYEKEIIKNLMNKLSLKNKHQVPKVEKIILIKVPNEIYSELRQIFIFLFENSGFKDVKINKTVDFEKLYKMRKIQ